MNQNDQMPREASSAAPARAEPELPTETTEQVASRIEAILISVDKPVPPAALAEAIGLGEPSGVGARTGPDDGPESSGKGAGESSGAPRSDAAPRVEDAVNVLNEQYASTGRAFRIERLAGGYRLMTLAEYAPVVSAFHHARAPAKLSRPALETLAIIAYRQPITRARLEAIRGVACGEVLKTLMDRRLVTIKGRAEELGRPMLYGTTKKFLDAFGLSSLKDLPPEAEVVGDHG